jgi:hypothetical protein
VGALFSWSAGLVNQHAVTELASKYLSGMAAGGRAIMVEVAEEAAPSFESLMEVIRSFQSDPRSRCPNMLRG